MNAPTIPPHPRDPVNTARKLPEAGRPRAGTLGASSQPSRFTRNHSVNTTVWQTKNRDQLDAARSAKLYAARMGRKGGAL